MYPCMYACIYVCMYRDGNRINPPQLWLPFKDQQAYNVINVCVFVNPIQEMEMEIGLE